mmetsp:Transcript_20681/g.29052  ORF Transcript_20681/g.29052 Transcript_20681/m.29052 type:complete len:83 (+) Transcript_20681:423-671(+)
MPGSTSKINFTDHLGKLQVDGDLVESGEFLCINHQAPASRGQIVFGQIVVIFWFLFLAYGPIIALLLFVPKIKVLGRYFYKR